MCMGFDMVGEMVTHESLNLRNLPVPGRTVRSRVSTFHCDWFRNIHFARLIFENIGKLKPFQCLCFTEIQYVTETLHLVRSVQGSSGLMKIHFQDKRYYVHSATNPIDGVRILKASNWQRQSESVAPCATSHFEYATAAVLCIIYSIFI